MAQKNDTILQGVEWYLPEDGSFWRRLKDLASSFSLLGFTSIWLPPAYKGQAGIHDVGYGVYDLYDLGEFDQKGTICTKYGTKLEYIDAVKTLKAQNLYVLADIVLKQRMGADELEHVYAIEENPTNRNQAVSGEEDVELWTKFTFPGRNGKYSDFIWNHACFDGTDWDEDDYKSAVYRIRGHHWDTQVDNELGNYDYLMGCDTDVDNPKVREELMKWGRWYFDMVHPDGVRMDALKHIDCSFIAWWLEQLREYRQDNFFAVGEYWNSSVDKLLRYLDINRNAMSLFDVPLHYRLFHASNSQGNFDMGLSSKIHLSKRVEVRQLLLLIIMIRNLDRHSILLCNHGLSNWYMH